MNLYTTLKMQDLIKTHKDMERLIKQLTEMSAEMVSSLNMQVMERFEDDSCTEPAISTEDLKKLATTYENFTFMWGSMLGQVVSLQEQLNRG